MGGGSSCFPSSPSSLHLLQLMYFLMLLLFSDLLALFGVLCFPSCTFLFTGVLVWILLSLSKLLFCSVDSSVVSSCSSFLLFFLLFFLVGWPGSILLCCSALAFASAFVLIRFLSLIFSSMVASFLISIMSSSLHLSSSLSPSLAVNLGSAQRLYSALLFIMMLFLSLWIITLSKICLLKAVFVLFITLSPNFTWSHSSSSSSWTSSRCLSIWLDVLHALMSLWCSSPRSYTLRCVSPTYTYLLAFLFSSATFLAPWLPHLFSISSSCLSLQVRHVVSYTQLRLLQS